MSKQYNLKKSEHTFCILGGGIAGLTTAIALKRIGIRAVVFEAAPSLEPVGAGVTLAYNALKALKHIGLYDEIISEGHIFKHMTILDDQGKIINQMDTSRIDGAKNLAIHRADLHQKLQDQLDPATITTGKRTTDIREVPGGYEIKFEDSSLIKTENLIVAEGIHSVIRKKMMPESQLRYAGYTCWRGIADHNPGISEPSETWGPNGRFGMVPVGDNRIYWFACKKAPANSEKMKAYGTDELYQEFKNYHTPIGELIRSTPSDQLIWNDIFDLKPIDRFVFGNLVLIGDAAHATTPNMGQGACQAIEDAVVLADCLQQSSLSRKAFQSFEQKRKVRTQAIVEHSWSMGKVAQWENVMLRNLRDFVFRLLPQRFYIRELEQVYDFKMN